MCACACGAFAICGDPACPAGGDCPACVAAIDGAPEPEPDPEFDEWAELFGPMLRTGER